MFWKREELFLQVGNHCLGSLDLMEMEGNRGQDFMQGAQGEKE